ncbi:glycosyltransferase family 2 protein [Faecalibacter sp. LW9]|uniref:glycosyltransferase family 2 protein n=1 Tax=Faecalibacter sp. LW9 TaxID=3103144 RepID=UPI002AFF93AF|nr:glycosyltransferase family 2 protein [Faecalibacter sp. LW9]
MKASIIITTFNRPIFLKRAIVSCFHQITDYNYEIIVVDDNGLNTPIQKETSDLIEKYPNVVYLPLEKNSGACIARNRGIQVAKGEYIFFLDDDDEFLPYKIQTQIRFLEHHPQWDGCLAAFKRINQTTNHEIIADSNFPKIGQFKDFVLGGNFFTPMLCVKKDVIDCLNGFDNISRFQDRYFMIKALKSGYNFEIMEDQLHIMYEHSQNRITNNGIKSTLISLDKIKNYIELNKNLFSHKEWDMFLIKDNRMRATAYYTSKSYFQRISAVPFYLNSFLISKEKKDIIMLLKTIIKFS